MKENKWMKRKCKDKEGKAKEESEVKETQELKNEVWVLKTMVQSRDEKIKRFRKRRNKQQRKYHFEAGSDQRKDL